MMHYYKRNIGDYSIKAGHLSALEHGVYTLLLDSYYNRERGPTKAEAIRWARARTAEELAAVDAVLAEFFTEEGGVYVQSRVEQELSTYRANAETNRAIAVAREKAKRARTVLEPSQDREPNHKPITKNQEEEQKREATRSPKGSRLSPDWQPSAEQTAWAAAERPDLDLQSETARFRDYWVAKPGKDGVKLDWPATFRNWIRNARQGPMKGRRDSSPPDMPTLELT